MSRLTSIILRCGDQIVTSPLVVLVGAPGSGKSAVGSALARLWNVDFRDTDADIEQATGRTIADIFVDDGEQAFRKLEREAVAAALLEHTGVVALGGGAITSEEVRRLLADHRVVWLQVGLATAAARVGLNRDRPLLMGNVRNTLLRLMQERAPWYESVAAFSVDTDAKSIGSIVDEIVAGLGDDR